ncbi:hypothetical protein ACIBHY_29480 [Nonomuraea sp. NPDC050547]|uniref:hypothetical protein n=1 Tax=Nonomuraea sp. NPDC050547 TaxID=3364368 RepID=UPI00379FC711
MSSKRKRNIRRIMASTGLNYTRAAEIDRQNRVNLRRRRNLTIGEIIEAISPGWYDSLMPRVRVANLMKDLVPAMPDYSKLLGQAVADQMKAAMPQVRVANLMKDLVPAMPDYSKLLGQAVADQMKAAMPQVRVANLMNDLVPAMPDYPKLLGHDPQV